MQSVPISIFKAHCLRLLEQVAVSGESLQVTKRGKPLVAVNPIAQPTPRRVLGIDQATARIVGDIIAPLDEPWEALS